MKQLIIATLFMITTYQLSAQTKLPTFNESKLAVSWEVIENNYQNKAQTLSAFTITNTGSKAIPVVGWEIYFNFARAIQLPILSAGAQIEHVNGDLYRLAINSPIVKEAPLKVEFISGDWLINFTDAPAGLYIVWDNKPTKGIPITAYTVKPSIKPKQLMRTAGDKVVPSNPEFTYNKNSNITEIPLNKLPKVFPTPVKIKENTGAFIINKDIQVAAGTEFKKESDYLLQELGTLIEKGTDSQGGGGKINLTKKNGLADEGYELSINANEINIAATTSAGVFYGIQSLKSLMPAEAWSGLQKEIKIPAVEIEDAPRFEHRALLLDVSRNFQPKQQLLKVLDLMALYKLNVFHFHLSDDEGWRLEIPSLPELTTVGSKRGHTVDNIDNLPPSLGSGPNVDNPNGSGFYSKADFIEILRYATARHILVITEIETPGHARAAVKAMDARYMRLLKEGKREEAEANLLHHANDKSVFSSVQMWNDNVIDVAMPSAYHFIETVVKDLELMYKEADAPLKTIHFGGDEVPAGVWERSPVCSILMRNNAAIKTTNDLWRYYFGKVNQILKGKGLYFSGWEEVGMRKVLVDGKEQVVPNPDFANQNFHVDVWNNVLGWGAEDLAYQMANSGYKVVLSGVSNLYFDMAYEKSFDEPGYYWGSYIDIDKIYDFIPFDYFKNVKEDRMGNPLNSAMFKNKVKLTDNGKANIVGIQGLLFGETVKGAERMDYMLLPKLLALAEKAWATEKDWAIEPDSLKSLQAYDQAWNEFVNVLGKKELRRLTYYKGGFNYRIPTAGARVEDGKVKANVQLPGFTIRYTTDGTEPTVESPVYSGPITSKTHIKLRVFNDKGRAGRTVDVENRPPFKN